jgi:protein-disulfide isomerase
VAGSCNIELPLPGPYNADSSSIERRDGSPRPVLLSSDHVLGNADAPLVVFMYEDYESTTCGRFVRNEFSEIKEQYIDTGRVLWVFRHFPRTNHDRAEPAARAAECADDQGLFFEYRDLIYATTESSGETILTDEQLEAHADTLDMDRTAFDACFSGRGKETRVQRDVDSAVALGMGDISALPAIIIEDELVFGFLTAEDLIETLDRHVDD